MSTLTVSNVSDGTLSIPTTYVTNGSAKAWVNFNGTGTIASRDSFNVSSLTDNGTGDYTVNFTSAMANGNYSTAHAGGQKTVNWGVYIGASSYGSTTTGHRFFNVTPGDVADDTIYVSLIFIGDLA